MVFVKNVSKEDPFGGDLGGMPGEIKMFASQSSAEDFLDMFNTDEMTIWKIIPSPFKTKV